jgi:hypothetical protein
VPNSTSTSSSSTSESGRKKKNDDALTNARLETEKSAVERNNSLHWSMDDLLVLGQKRKHRLTIVDEILAPAAKINEIVEHKPKAHDEKTR